MVFVFGNDTDNMFASLLILKQAHPQSPNSFQLPDLTRSDKKVKMNKESRLKEKGLIPNRVFESLLGTLLPAKSLCWKNIKPMSPSLLTDSHQKKSSPLFVSKPS